MLQLRQSNPELIPPGADNIDALRQAHVPMEFKRDILNTVWRKAGPETLLSIGQGISNITYDPIWSAALRSASPAILFDKWRRFEVFAHSRNRVRIDQTNDNSALFQRYAADGSIPTAPENLLICGLIIGLLESIGCRGLWCKMAHEDGSDLCIRDRFEFNIPAVGLVTDNWTIGWQAHVAAKGHIATGDEASNVNLPPVRDPALEELVRTMVKLLMSDVARQWKIGEVARELGRSTRSLQRSLANSELSFSQLIRVVRIHEACCLLKKSSTSITAIGFCAGFSDSAHFSRDFRASVGITPSDYRAVC